MNSMPWMYKHVERWPHLKAALNIHRMCQTYDKCSPGTPPSKTLVAKHSWISILEQRVNSEVRQLRAPQPLQHSQGFEGQPCSTNRVKRLTEKPWRDTKCCVWGVNRPFSKSAMIMFLWTHCVSVQCVSVCVLQESYTSLELLTPLCWSWTLGVNSSDAGRLRTGRVRIKWPLQFWQSAGESYPL